MTRKGLASLLLFILFISVNQSNAQIGQNNGQILATPISIDPPSTDVFETYLTIDDLSWSFGLTDNDMFTPFDMFTGSGYSFEINETEFHCNETTGLYDVWLGGAAEVPITNNMLSLTFEARARAGHVDPVTLRLGIYDPVTLKELRWWTVIGHLGVLDTGFLSFNQTFYLEGYSSVIIFFYQGDGWIANWNQEFWVRNLKIYTDVDENILLQDPVISFISSPGSECFGTMWYDNHIWNIVYRHWAIYKFDPITGDIIANWSLPTANPRGITHDGSFFWYSDTYMNNLYKLNDSFDIIDTLAIPVFPTGGIVFDGQDVWVGNTDANMLYKIDLNTGNILTSFSAPGQKAKGLAYYGGYLWMSDSTDNRIYQIFPHNGTVKSFYEVPIRSFWGLTIDNFSYVWVSSFYTAIIFKLNIQADIDSSPPVILSNGDFSCEQGSLGNHINWTLQDENPDTYTIYRNDLEFDTDSWVNDDLISINVDYLIVGEYNYTIVVYDYFGNYARDTVLVTIISTEDTSYPFAILTILVLGISIISTVTRRKRKKEFR